MDLQFQKSTAFLGDRQWNIYRLKNGDWLEWHCRDAVGAQVPLARSEQFL